MLEIGYRQWVELRKSLNVTGRDYLRRKNRCVSIHPVYNYIDHILEIYRTFQAVGKFNWSCICMCTVTDYIIRNLQHWAANVEWVGRVRYRIIV